MSPKANPGDTTAVIVFRLTGALGLVLISANGTDSGGGRSGTPTLSA